MKTLVILITVLYLAVDSFAIPDYFWREYYGAVPEDAVVAGRDVAGNNVYIGQGFVPEIGVVPGRLINGSKTMNVGSNWKNYVTSFIKVLCGPQEKFYWLTANKDNLHLLLGDKHAVVGGYQEKYLHGIIYKQIGKVNINGKAMVGKIDMLSDGNSHFLYADGNKEHEVYAYQALIYEDIDIDQRINIKAN